MDKPHSARPTSAQPHSTTAQLPAHVHAQIQAQKDQIIKRVTEMVNDQHRPYLLSNLQWLIESIWRREYPGRRTE